MFFKLRVFILGGVAACLSGCFSPVVFALWDGPATCPSRLAADISDTRIALSSLRYGLNQQQATQLFRAAPEEKKMFVLAGNRHVETYLYRTAQPEGCRFAEDGFYRLTPVFFENQRYIGHGYQFYETQILPYAQS